MRRVQPLPPPLGLTDQVESQIKRDTVLIVGILAILGIALLVPIIV